MRPRIWGVSPSPLLNAAETRWRLTNLLLKKKKKREKKAPRAPETDKIAEDEDRNKILKHQGTILREGDNGGRARVKRIFFFKKRWVKTDGQKEEKK